MHRWLLWTFLAVFCWGIWALLGKVIGEAISPALTQALSTIGLIPVMLLMLLTIRKNGRAGIEEKGSVNVRRRGAMIAAGAGILTCLGNVAYYGVLNQGTKAATVVPLTALYPVVTVILAVIILKERLNGIQLSGMVLSLVAIYLLNVQQEQSFLTPWLLAALIPIAFWGIAGLLLKLATNNISGELSTLWFLAAFIPVAIWILVQERLPATIGFRIWLLVMALGLSLGLGNYALLAALASNGKASVITPLTGLYPLVSIPIAILLLKERIGWRETLGIALALVSAAALSYESRAEPSEITTLKPEIPK